MNTEETTQVAAAKPLRLLVVEDSPRDAEIVVREIRRGGFDVTWKRADTAEAMRSALDAEPWDAIISDYNLPRFDGLASLRVLQEKAIDIPFIIVSGTIGEEAAVALMKAGANDFSMKNNLARLVPAIERELREAANRRAHKTMEEALRASELRYRRLFESAKDGILILDADTGMVVDVNPFLIEMLGYPREEFLEKRIWELGSFKNVIANQDKFTELQQVEYIRYKDLPLEDCKGKLHSVEFISNVYLVNGLKVIQCNIRDISQRKQAEAEHEKLQAQFTQAQKMESVGRLAGGVAHDFNNLLMGTMGYTQLCLDKIGPDHPIREYLDEIMSVTERSAELTRQLLAFARKQIIAPTVMDLNDAISDILKLLRRLIGEDVTMKFTEDPDTWPVKMDPVQIDQILANLCVNARDAIGGVGSVNIETSNATFDESYCAGHQGSVPGDYALLTVTDTGCGMDKETLENIFEPFFTTKGVGEGTGLGLATVYGIVKQNNGYITVYSEHGKGTTFKIYLPRHVCEETALAAVAAPTKSPHGTETVLLVEDEKSIRITTRLFLEDLGYTVLVAEAPSQALRLVAEHPGEIHLLITDVVMPGMSGRELANRLLALRPSIKRLFISGFTADVIAQRGILDDGMNFLSKPFGRDVLARKAREVLEEKGEKK